MKPIFILLTEPAPTPKNKVTCTICTDLVELVDEAVTSNQTINDVRKNLVFKSNYLVY